MQNQIIEHDGKAYIVESVEGEKLKTKQYVYDRSKGKFVKQNGKTIEKDYSVISPEVAKIRFAVDGTDNKSKTAKETEGSKEDDGGKTGEKSKNSDKKK